MSETKIGLVRQFGTEQFSMTVTLDKVSDATDVTNSVEALHKGVSEAFNKVLAREDIEKALLIKNSQNREEKNIALTAQLKKEMDTASVAKGEIKKVENFVKKSNYKK